MVGVWYGHVCNGDDCIIIIPQSVASDKKQNIVWLWVQAAIDRQRYDRELAESTSNRVDAAQRCECNAADAMRAMRQVWRRLVDNRMLVWSEMPGSRGQEPGEGQTKSLFLVAQRTSFFLFGPSCSGAAQAERLIDEKRNRTID